ncbi:MAG: XRE family transcriptional regulator [Planctomycetota bacterium]|nr:MAG: XRE family transcriptional regulator [Planctomycetota bacterium]REK28403.1 MAG: XRE family transcriptional regulator [Planctomycetota bacterium]REK48419.1 MAG: XRE family transcriptional regulator [Planctomycetota bacterium]
MGAGENNWEHMERRLYASLRDAGAIIPQTAEEVAQAEARVAASPIELPERLRDSRQAFARMQARIVGTDASSTPHVFGKLIAMLRIQRRLSVEALAAKAQVELQEIAHIEAEPDYEPKPRTVKQLADVFGVAPSAMARVANLTRQTDERIVEEAVRFAACAKDMDKLTREQWRVLKEFVSLLNSID